MTNEFHHSGTAYKAFDSMIMKLENKISQTLPSIGLHSADVVEGRVIQRIVSLTLNAYISLCSLRVKTRKSLLPTEENLVMNGIVLETKTSAIKIHSKLLLISFAEFFYEWGATLMSILQGMRSFKDSRMTPAVLVYGIGAESLQFEGSDLRFKEFCLQGPIAPLAASKRLIVQSFFKIKSESSIEYSSRPINKLLSNTPFKVSTRLQLLGTHLLIPFRYFFTSFRFPLIALLGRDYALIGILSQLKSYNIIESVIITNSNYSDQFLWMRNSTVYGFKTHEIHYAQNTRPVIYSKDPIEVDLPSFRHVKVDEHWVWTEGYRKHLQSLFQEGPIHVVGPIVFYLPKISSQLIKERSVVIFDITPVYDEVSEKIGLIKNYYNTGNMLRFMGDIISACNELNSVRGFNLRILLKHKRGFNKHHDKKYIDYCKSMSLAGTIKLIEHDENVYSLVQKSMVAISVPYTSTAYIACAVKTPSIFYDTTGEIIPSFDPCSGLEMISGAEDLKKRLEKIIDQAMENVK